MGLPAYVDEWFPDRLVGVGRLRAYEAGVAKALPLGAPPPQRPFIEGIMRVVKATDDCIIAWVVAQKAEDEIRQTITWARSVSGQARSLDVVLAIQRAHTAYMAALEAVRTSYVDLLRDHDASSVGVTGDVAEERRSARLHIEESLVEVTATLTRLTPATAKLRDDVKTLLDIEGEEFAARYRSGALAPTGTSITESALRIRSDLLSRGLPLPVVEDPDA